MLVGPTSETDIPRPSVGERGVPPDAVAYESGVVVKVIYGPSGPLRVRVVLADRGERGLETTPVLVTDLEMIAGADLLIGLEESDTGWTVLTPSLPNGAPLEIFLSILERTTVREATGTLSIPSAIEIQVGDPDAVVREHEPDDDEEWRSLVE